MNARTALSIAVLAAVVACMSCASRQAEPVEPAGPQEPQPAAPSAPMTQADPAEPALSDAVSTVLDGVRVAHQVPVGWELDLSRSDRGQINMHRPDGAASLGIIFAPANGHAPVDVLTALYLHWMEAASGDNSITVERPMHEALPGGEVWGLIVRTHLGTRPITVAHVFTAANDPSYLMTAIGAWPAEDGDDTYLRLLGTIAGGASILPNGD